TTARFRAWPMPVTTTWSIHSFASVRSSPGRIPIVVPPADFAPRATAAMTSPSPPHTTVTPRSASRRPTASARSSCSLPLRMMCPHAELLLGRAVALDPARRRVQVETDEELVNVTYEDVVVALGAISRSLPIPGLAEHGLGFKSLADAIQLRNHVLRRLEL